MAADVPPQLFDVADSVARHISRGRHGQAGPVAGPGRGARCLGVPGDLGTRAGRSRPIAIPARSRRSFSCRASGTAYCDDTTVEVHAGQLLVLPARSLHRIESSPDGEAVRHHDHGPRRRLRRPGEAGSVAPLDDEERAVLAQAAGCRGHPIGLPQVRRRARPVLSEGRGQPVGPAGAGTPGSPCRNGGGPRWSRPRGSPGWSLRARPCPRS